MGKQAVVITGHHVPTKRAREQVSGMVACGLNAAEIAHVLGTDEATVRLHYEQEVRHGVAATTAKVGGALLKAAMRGDSNAARFWLQARARWSVPTKVELTGKDGEPIKIEERRKLMDSIVSMAGQGDASEDEQRAMEEKQQAVEH